MCKCKNVDFGSYDNQVMVEAPHAIGFGRPVCLDTCIAEEVMDLWRRGITTTGCCCGHNKTEGYIGVMPDDIQRMEELGYKVAYNEIRPEDDDSFLPKSIINNYYPMITSWSV